MNSIISKYSRYMSTFSPLMSTFRHTFNTCQHTLNLSLHTFKTWCILHTANTFQHNLNKYQRTVNSWHHSLYKIIFIKPYLTTYTECMLIRTVWLCQYPPNRCQYNIHVACQIHFNIDQITCHHEWQHTIITL